MKNNVKKNLIFLLIFGIGMGFLEAIVVFYIRYIYYPEGFSFPLAMMSKEIYIAELIREICTIIMLFSISIIAGKNRLQIVAYFLFSFAIWDIFYYIALKLFLNWPPSLLTWDVLFFIPIIWIGPVIAPIICSFTMILFSSIILFMQDKKIDFKITKIEWLFLGLGSLFIFITFIWDSLNILVSNNLIGEYLSSKQTDILKHVVLTYIPSHYNWTLFIIGIICIYFSIFLILRKSFFIKSAIRNHDV